MLTILVVVGSFRQLLFMSIEVAASLVDRTLVVVAALEVNHINLVVAYSLVDHLVEACNLVGLLSDSHIEVGPLEP